MSRTDAHLHTSWKLVLQNTEIQATARTLHNAAANDSRSYTISSISELTEPCVHSPHIPRPRGMPSTNKLESQWHWRFLAARIEQDAGGRPGAQVLATGKRAITVQLLHAYATAPCDYDACMKHRSLHASSQTLTHAIACRLQLCERRIAGMDDDGSGPRQGLSDLYALHDEALVRHLAGAHSPSAPASWRGLRQTRPDRRAQRDSSPRVLQQSL